MVFISPAQRALVVMSRHYGRTPPWIGEATELERLGIAQYASEQLENIKELNPLEALLGATRAVHERKTFLLRTVAARHPQLSLDYLDNATTSPWSLGTDAQWQGLNLHDQLLMARYAAVTLNILRPERSGDISTHAVCKVLESTPDNIQNDPLLQCIIASNNPSLFSMLMHSGSRTQPVAPQAVAIGFLHGRNVSPKWYDQMDSAAFSSLIAHDSTQNAYGNFLPSVLGRNLTLHRFPQDKLPLLLEYNPMLFIASVIMNRDVANAQQRVSRWFEPMLHAAAQRVQEDPTYMDVVLTTSLLVRQKQTFGAVVDRHAPAAYQHLDVLRQLYADPSAQSQKPVLRQWLAYLHQGDTPTVPVFNMEDDVFDLQPWNTSLI